MTYVLRNPHGGYCSKAGLRTLVLRQAMKFKSTSEASAYAILHYKTHYEIKKV